MFRMVRDLLHTENENDFNKLFSRIEKYENISDNMEVEIASYLTLVSEGRLSSESKVQIRGMLREVTEIESIGDSCYNLARTCCLQTFRSFGPLRKIYVPGSPECRQRL